MPTNKKKRKEKNLRSPGIEPGSTAWKATMLTITPATHLLIMGIKYINNDTKDNLLVIIQYDIIIYNINI